MSYLLDTNVCVDYLNARYPGVVRRLQACSPDDVSGASDVDYTVTGSGANPADAADFANGVLPSGTVSFAAGETAKTVTLGSVTGELDDKGHADLDCPPLESGAGFNSRLFNQARQLVRGTAERSKSNEQRLREYAEIGADRNLDAAEDEGATLHQPVDVVALTDAPGRLELAKGRYYPGAQDRTLATARCADDGDELTGFDNQIQPLQGDNFLRAWRASSRARRGSRAYTALPNEVCGWSSMSS